jgi:hypothetical protein
MFIVSTQLNGKKSPVRAGDFYHFRHNSVLFLKMFNFKISTHFCPHQKPKTPTAATTFRLLRFQFLVIISCILLLLYLKRKKALFMKKCKIVNRAIAVILIILLIVSQFPMVRASEVDESDYSYVEIADKISSVIESHSHFIKPGESLSFADVISIADGIRFVSIAGKVDLTADVIEIQVDAKSFLDNNKELKDLVDTVLGGADGMKLSVEEARSMIISLGAMDENFDFDAILKLIDLLDRMSEIDEIGEIVLNLTADGNICFDGIGTYIVAAITTDASCKTAVDAGCVFVGTANERLQLRFEEIHDEVLLLEDVMSMAYDFGIKVSDRLAQGDAVSAFIGVDIDGNMIFSKSAPESSGVYVQIAYLADEDGLYLAAPISRIFTVVESNVNMQFISDDKVVEGYSFVFGNQAPDVDVVVKTESGEILTNGELTLQYVGASLSDGYYNSAIAPKTAGAYVVVARYMSENGEHYGTATVPFIVEQAIAEFAMEDMVVEYDGEKHINDIVNPIGLHSVEFIIDNKNVNILIESADFSYEIESVEAAIVSILPIIREFEDHEHVAKLIEILESAKDYNIKINGDLPSAIGEYDVFAIGFAANYRPEFEHAVLTINDNINDSPETGDAASVFVTMMLVSLFGAIAVAYIVRKKTII